jgi:hypothetical protein
MRADILCGGEIVVRSLFSIDSFQGANDEMDTYQMRLDDDTCEADDAQQHQEPLPYLSFFKLHLHKTLD